MDAQLRVERCRLCARVGPRVNNARGTEGGGRGEGCARPSDTDGMKSDRGNVEDKTFQRQLTPISAQLSTRASSFASATAIHSTS